MILSVGHSARRRPARYLRAAVTGLIGGVWVAYLVAQWSALRAHDWTLAPVPLLAGFGFAAAHWVLLGLGWWQAHQAIGGQLDPFAALRLWTNSMMWRYLPGNVWHVLGRVYLSGAAGERRAAILASSLLEQILTLAGACLVILFCVPAWPAGRWLLAPAALGLAGGFLILQPVGARLITRTLARWTGQPCDLVPPAPERLVRLLLLFAWAQASAGLSLWALAAAVGSPADPLPLIGAAAAGWAIGYLSLLTPSGLGVREGALVVFLTPLLGAPTALLTSLLSRPVLMIAEASLWALWALTPSGNRRQPANGGPPAIDGDPEVTRSS